MSPTYVAAWFAEMRSFLRRINFQMIQFRPPRSHSRFTVQFEEFWKQKDEFCKYLFSELN